MKAQHVELTLDDQGERLDKALTAAMPELSRMQWQRLIKEDRVLVNGQSANPAQRLRGGEQITADIPEAVESELLAEPIPLDIRYEDDDILIVNKPAGMVVHPGTGHNSGTLVNALLAHCPDLPGIGNTKRPGIVHRLDKYTSGLLVVAKNDFAQRYLQKQFKERSVGKKYLALVHGQIQPPSALIDAPIGRDPHHRKRMSVIVPGTPRAGSARARSAQTQYRTIEFFEEFSLIECALFTGRTHQIRVHLAYIDFPIVGDHVYGRRKLTFTLKRQFLHAAELTLKRPADDQEVSFSAELSAELQAILDTLRA
ncbi:MAG: RluA family pseudouridine synthase [Candidatus Promineifilaceae bacterium]|nr:RluA family pseudouridine synthase [Candidatus Promineifilaceae bacterium]